MGIRSREQGPSSCSADCAQSCFMEASDLAVRLDFASRGAYSSRDFKTCRDRLFITDAGELGFFILTRQCGRPLTLLPRDDILCLENLFSPPNEKINQVVRVGKGSAVRFARKGFKSLLLYRWPSTRGRLVFLRNQVQTHNRFYVSRGSTCSALWESLPRFGDTPRCDPAYRFFHPVLFLMRIFVLC